jgi:hypothetical protein
MPKKTEKSTDMTSEMTSDEATEQVDELRGAEADALIEDDASGWFPDPDHEGQERFWDGAEWTDEVRRVDEETGYRARLHLPDHVPELQRALAAATADIDDVEAKLSNLFDRGQGKGRGKKAEAAEAPLEAPDDGSPIQEEFGGGRPGDASSDGAGDPMDMRREGAGEVSVDDDEATFTELDEALAAEAPEKADRRFFKRRS